MHNFQADFMSTCDSDSASLPSVWTTCDRPWCQQRPIGDSLSSSRQTSRQTSPERVSYDEHQSSIDFEDLPFDMEQFMAQLSYHTFLQDEEQRHAGTGMNFAFDPNASGRAMQRSHPNSGRTTKHRNHNRNYQEARYKTELCLHYRERGDCPHGVRCLFAHGSHELRPYRGRHPKHKTQFCKAFHEEGYCNYGYRCSYIHLESPNTIRHLRSLNAQGQEARRNRVDERGEQHCNSSITNKGYGKQVTRRLHFSDPNNNAAEHY